MVTLSWILKAAFRKSSRSPGEEFSGLDEEVSEPISSAGGEAEARRLRWPEPWSSVAPCSSTAVSLDSSEASILSSVLSTDVGSLLNIELV